MSREIHPNQSYKDKLLKLIPSEIVGAYMVIQGILSGQNILIGDKDITASFNWAIFIIIFLLTPLFLLRVHNVRKTSQLIITSISFIIWGYSLGGPFAVSGLYQPQIASILLVLWTLIIPLAIKTKTS
ncbi:MAG: hypothetical protein H0Z29_09110 [Candidatus Marinimicrobia bacterium]|nr:hypothetical protein [Candidatus Neomarinimicrobiota bacterium]